MKDIEFDKESWFKLTKEQQDDYIKDVIIKAVEEDEIMLFIIAKDLIPHFLEKEEYEIVDLLNKITLKLNTHGM